LKHSYGTIKSPEKINAEFIAALFTPIIQRLGYILDRLVDHIDLAQKLYEVSNQNNRKFFLQPFKTGGNRKRFDTDERWEIIINTTIEFEE
jgi:hypothetical protein